MQKLNAIQTRAVNAYATFLDGGMSYGDAMRAAARRAGAGDGPIPTVARTGHERTCGGFGDPG